MAGSMLFSIIKNIWIGFSERMQEIVISLLGRIGYFENSRIIKILDSRVGYRELREYAYYLCNHFEEEVEKIKQNPVFVRVNFDHQCGLAANTTILIIEHTVAAMRKGAIPVSI